MFKIDKKTNKIFLTKGDNAELTIDVIDSNGNARGIYDDDVVVMTVRKNVNSDVAITKNAVKNTISSLAIFLVHLCYNIHHKKHLAIADFWKTWSKTTFFS